MDKRGTCHNTKRLVGVLQVLLDLAKYLEGKKDDKFPRKAFNF